MKKILEKIIAHEHLSSSEAHEQLLRLATQNTSTEAVIAFIVGMQVKGVQLNELKGFQAALLNLSSSIDFGTTRYIDVCGTGGDQKNTFNISTCSAFVLASMGYPVVKHGNYGVSSTCGSSNVLEYLGIKFSANESVLKRQLEKFNLVFLHAPIFHPVLTKFAPIRKQLGIPTFFNDLGPLVNPAKPDYQLSGTYQLSLARYYQHILSEKRKAFYVVHGLNGYDELTFHGGTRILGKTEDFVLSETPNQDPIHPTNFQGGTIPESAEILKTILAGNGNQSQNAIVAGNVALGIRCFEPKVLFEHAFQSALDHIDSGKAIHLLKAFQS